MIVLDTDVITLLHRPTSAGHQAVIKQLEVLTHDGDGVAVTIISFEEQMRGWLKHLGGQDVERQVAAYERLRRLIADYQKLPVLPFDAAAAERFVALRRVHRRAGAMDLKIAAITLTQGAALLTGNERDFGAIDALALHPLRRT